MMRFYTRLGLSPSSEELLAALSARELEKVQSVFDVVRADDEHGLEEAMFRVADALDSVFTPLHPTMEVRVNARTGCWSMTLRNPQAGLRVVITGEAEDLPVVKEKISEWLE